MNKDIILQRIFDNGESTIGYMIYNDTLLYTIEDTFRVDKIRGETRISAGRYKLSIRPEMSDKTKQYKAKFSWFKYHIELADVPNFKYVYIHIGNSAKDSEGCLLVAKYPNNNAFGTGFISESTPIFEQFYKWAYPKLHNGEELFIQVRNEIHREDILKEQIKMKL